jgi:7-cyano-7-deazaguanine reductase
MSKQQATKLTKLGSKRTLYTYVKPKTGMLETFPNNHPSRDYTITHTTDEFTSLCPKTGQPDFATMTINIIPNKACVESKSLKLYLFSFRNEGAFMEMIVNRILDDLCAVCKPRYCEVIGDFGARGGIKTRVEATYADPNWK